MSRGLPRVLLCNPVERESLITLEVFIGHFCLIAITSIGTKSYLKGVIDIAPVVPVQKDASSVLVEVALAKQLWIIAQ